MTIKSNCHYAEIPIIAQARLIVKLQREPEHFIGAEASRPRPEQPSMADKTRKWRSRRTTRIGGSKNVLNSRVWYWLLGVGPVLCFL